MFLFLSPLAHRLLPLFSLVAHRFSPPLAGVGGGHPELVEGLPAGTVENRSLQPRCSSTLRRARGPRPTASSLSPFSSLIAHRLLLNKKALSQ